jgi:hypothetical protein
MFLGLLWCNAGFAENVTYIKCIDNKYNNEVFIKIDFENNKLGYAIENTLENLNFKITKVTEELIVAKQEAISIEKTFDDGAIYQANDIIVIDRIIGSAKIDYETLKDTRKESTPSPYIIIPKHYWSAKGCKLIKDKAKF